MLDEGLAQPLGSLRVSRHVSLRTSAEQAVSERSRLVAAILIVGDEPALVGSLADQLTGWQISTSVSREAVQSIRSTLPDLLIFCHTVPDETAEELVRLARELNPSVRALGICPLGETRKLNAEHYDTRLRDAG
jgi:hypothetical protein